MTPIDLRAALRSTFRRALRLENRRAAVRPGRLERIPRFESKILGNARELVVYLPPGYEEHEDRRYPVLYMHDGQNLFDSDRAFIPGQHWRLREAADEAIGAEGAEPVIIVGIDHAGPARIDEYTPTRDPKKNAGGRAPDHARMVIEEIKPLIDSRYRTLPAAADTAVGGSSLGGLDALYLAMRHPNVFARVAVMSPSVWWHDRVILKEVEGFAGEPRPRAWLDAGVREGAEALRDVRALRDLMLRRGWNEADLLFREERRGDHSERAWAARARPMLEFLFPPRRL
ncbi:MAG TPA: alpha/beta hydrolase-fold protein [Thermoanaerobaculia bacterium]|nr:alpha/beta hydrolase-fold protein [Thermoanaerobaculia bacterium]